MPYDLRKWTVEQALVATIFALILAIFSIPLAIGVLVGSWTFCGDLLLITHKHKV
jgi:hypothetical protein